ncbi:MAG TPA: Wzz/FepE/Etk N-terminal domain-containing protein [Roseiarcus sp.]|jgi:capsular polysaccharide biosynthesis protein
MDLRAAVRFMRKNARLFLVWLAAALCIGVAFIKITPAYYTAYTTLLLEDQLARQVADQAGPAAPADPAYADSQVELLQSYEVVGRVVQQDRFKDSQEGTFEGLSALLSQFFSRAQGRETSGPSAGLASSDTATTAAAKAASERFIAIRRLRHGLSVRRIGVSNAIEIGFTSRDPLRSAAIANAVAQTYIDNQVNQKRKTQQDAAARVQERLADLRAKAFIPDGPFSGPETGEQALAKSRELQTRTETFRALYNNLLQRHYSDTSDQFVSPSARVITPAEPPNDRSWPKTFVVLATVVAGGAACGSAHALLKQAMDRSLRTIEDVQRVASVDIIAGVPRIKRRSWRTGRFRQNGLQQPYTNVSAKFSETMGKFAVRLQGRQTRRSGLIIGVVAPTAGAGTSSIAANLARIIAETGQRTLLVDANWRKPSTEQNLLEPSPGRKLATGFAMINLASESLVVLLLRSIAPISELNASLSIVATLQQQRAEYDCVVVDFPSVEQTADFEASVTTIDEVIVVVEAGEASCESLGGFLRLVPKNKIAAVVLNKV